MSNQVALIIVFNHRYDKNIEILEKIYKNKFSNIYHLVPFYNGKKNNVIPVYEHSHFFQGYISQGFRSFFKKEYSHYLFVADDMILNPTINEGNYQNHFGLDDNSCFIPELISFHTLKNFWLRTRQAYQYNPKLWGVEAEKELPSYEEAQRLFSSSGLEVKPISFNQIYAEQKFPVKPSEIRPYLKHLALKLKYRGRQFKFQYPLVGAYSDILVVSHKNIQSFCHYCGAFAATRLFVEIAIPTALVLSSEKVVTENDLALKGKALWSPEELNELEPYQFKLSSLLENFPKKYLYLHPVKLSKWDISGI